MTVRQPARRLRPLLVLVAAAVLLASAACRVPPELSDQAPAPTLPTCAAGTARAVRVLSCLEVKGGAPKTGYDRSLFGFGTDIDQDGCGARDSELAHDLERVTFEPGTHNCVVLTGVLPYEPYTGQHHRSFDKHGDYAHALDTEHVVALGDAWQKGAARWPTPRLVVFANDPLNLMMVDPSQNRSHGDGDAATWLPPNKPYRCGYVATQIAVKTKYRLWVAPAERDAMARVLTRCPGQQIPTGPDPVIVPPTSRVTSWSR